MGTQARTIAHLTDLLPGTTAKKMFGEYALYLDAKVVALICDDTLYVKPLPAALALLGDTDLVPPYPGAKPHIRVTDALDDPDCVMSALHAVAAAR
jgi:TfoX/Sxy family transcriptional regulator of competence genes